MESIIDGTWASGAPPREYSDFVLMREFRWTWRDLEETPQYVKMYCWDFLQRIFEHEQDEMEKARKARNKR